MGRPGQKVVNEYDGLMTRVSPPCLLHQKMLYDWGHAWVMVDDRGCKEIAMLYRYAFPCLLPTHRYHTFFLKIRYLKGKKIDTFLFENMYRCW